MVKDKSYTITEIEFEDGIWEVEAYQAEGKEIELEVNPMSGKILF